MHLQYLSFLFYSCICCCPCAESYDLGVVASCELLIFVFTGHTAV